MNYLEFKKTYNNKYVDYDGSLGSQCWDLAQYYFVKVLNLPSSVLAGCGLVSNMLKEPKLSVLLKYFEEVPVKNMKQGDIAIWTYGHIAIFDSKTPSAYFFFSQNPNASKVIEINTKNCRCFRLKTKKENTSINKEIIYSVKSGDTLSKIAKKYNTTWQKIYNDNKSEIDNTAKKHGKTKNFYNYIYVGQKIRIK